MAASKTPLQCLTQIHEDMPAWMERIDRLTKLANERYVQWTKDSEHTGNSAPLLNRRKTGSMESLKPRDEEEKEEEKETDEEKAAMSTTSPLPTTPAGNTSLQPLQSPQPTVPTAAKLEIDPHNRHLFREIREQRRKRKNPSLKDGASGPARFRVRGNFTIWYDSTVQSEFESLVRSISGARNILRKGKAAASFKVRLGSLKDEESPYGRRAYAHPFQMRTVPRLSQPGSSYLTNLKTGLETYDLVDKELESAQTLCEVGAHQFLRDGDCFDELETTKVKFEKSIELVSAEIKLLKEQEDSDKARNSASTRQSTSPTASSPSGLRPRLLKRSLSSIDPDAIAIDGPLEADDDADQESIEIDLMQLPGRRHYSSRHVMMSKLGADTSLDAGNNAEALEPGSQNAAVKPEAVNGANIRDSTDVETSLTENIFADSGILVASSQSDGDEEPEFDLTAMRKSALNRFSTASTSNDDNKNVESAVPSVALDAAAIGLAATDDEPELDLMAMRSSINPRRANCARPVNLPMEKLEALVTKIHGVNNVKIPATDIPLADEITVSGSATSDEEPEVELDLAAMRAAVGRRGPRIQQAAALSTKDESKQNQHKHQHQHQQEANKNNCLPERSLVEKIVDIDVPIIPDYAVDSAMATSGDGSDSPGIPDNIAAMLRNIRGSQAV